MATKPTNGDKQEETELKGKETQQLPACKKKHQETEMRKQTQEQISIELLPALKDCKNKKQETEKKENETEEQISIEPKKVAAKVIGEVQALPSCFVGEETEESFERSENSKMATNGDKQEETELKGKETQEQISAELPALKGCKKKQQETKMKGKKAQEQISVELPALKGCKKKVKGCKKKVALEGNHQAAAEILDPFELPAEFDIPDMPCRCDHPKNCCKCHISITTHLSRYNRSHTLWTVFNRRNYNEVCDWLECGSLTVEEVLTGMKGLDDDTVKEIRSQIWLLQQREAKNGPFKIERDGSFTL